MAVIDGSDDGVVYEEPASFYYEGPDDPAYEAAMREADEEHELVLEANRASSLSHPMNRSEGMVSKEWDFCSKCGCLAVIVTSVPTRQYGGGWNTQTECQFCGDAEVYV